MITNLTNHSGSKLLLISSLLASVSSVLPLSAEIDFGRAGAIAFGLDADVEHNSNINLNSQEDSDIIFSALPKLLYRQNRGELVINGFAGMEIQRYDQASGFDSENFKSGLNVRYPAGGRERNFELDLNAGFNETSDADPFLQTILEREVMTASLGGRYFFTERYYMRSSLAYRDSEPTTPGFSSVRTIVVPVDFFYRYSEDLALGLGYRYRDTEIDGAATPADSGDHAVYLAAEGQLLPSVEGELRVGLQKREFVEDAFEDADAAFAEIILDWAIREGTSLKLSTGNEFITTSTNHSVEAIYLELLLSHQFDEKISGYVGTGYREADFSTLGGANFRSDDKMFLELGAEYVLIEDRLVLEGMLFHGDQSSNLANADYQQSIARVGLSLVY